MVSNKRNKKKPEYPCSVCGKNVNNNNLAILCMHCKLWSHNKCNNIEIKQYREHQLNPELPFNCIRCNENIFPFMKLNDFEFDSFLKKGIDNVQFTNFTPSVAQQEMFDRLNSEIEDYNTEVINEEPELNFNNQISCNYYNVDEFRSCKFSPSKNFSIMHLNIHSIQAHIGELISLLNMIDHKFDIIAISESKLSKDPNTDINIPSYHEPSITKTEAGKGGTMIYVAKGHNFKPRKDLEIYQSKDLESTFIEVINPKESNDIVD